MNEIDYIIDECNRQHVTNYGDFAKGLDYARSVSRVFFNQDFGKFVQTIAFYVEPEVNAVILHGDRYTNLRRSEVGFMHGGSAAKAVEVPRLFERWAFFVGEEGTGNEDFFVKQLLDIHPWADGNGRTASILRNWLCGSLNDPEPLPYYYGGK